MIPDPDSALLVVTTRRSACPLREAPRGLRVVHQPDWPAVGCLEFLIRVDSQLEVENGGQVGRGDRALGRHVAAAVGLAQDQAPGNPPPVTITLLARPWWSRPALALILGVRPNSPIMTTSVWSRSFRSARSPSKADSPWSSGGASVFLSVGKFCACVSQPRGPGDQCRDRYTLSCQQ